MFQYSPYESSPNPSRSASLLSLSSSSSDSTFGDHQPPPITPLSFTFPLSKPKAQPRRHEPENFYFQDGDVEIHLDGGKRVFRIHRYKTLDRSNSRLLRPKAREGGDGGVQVVRVEEGDKVLCWEVLLSALYDEDSFISQPDLSLFHVYALLHLSEKYQFREMHRLAAGLFDDLCEMPEFGMGEMGGSDDL